jgi:hypothetical protein
MIPYIAIAFIITAFFVQDFGDVFRGFWAIQINESILLTDYIEIGGIGATLLNSGILMLLNYFLIKGLKIRMSGPIFAGILTIGGFAFFGKNILNISIIYLGAFLYARHKQINLKSIAVIFLFSSGIAPISSLFVFGLGLPLLYSIPLGIIVGVMAGFLLVELSAHAITFHKGYDLYNVGFAGGIIILLVMGITTQLGLGHDTNLLLSTDYHLLLMGITIVISLMFLFTGLIMNDFKIKNYKEILSQSGRAITDFTRKDNYAITLINIGLTTLLVLILITILQIQINGPVMGAIMTVTGFSAFGKHIRNVFPSMIGVYVMSLIFGYETSNISIALAIIFSTGLAPLTGEKGYLVGFIAGMAHLPLVLAFSSLLGGVLLYTNGFAAAFTAVIINNFLMAFERGNNKWRFMKRLKVQK